MWMQQFLYHIQPTLGAIFPPLLAWLDFWKELGLPSTPIRILFILVLCRVRHCPPYYLLAGTADLSKCPTTKPLVKDDIKCIMQIDNFNEAEAIIESAIRSKEKSFTLDISSSYRGIIPKSIGNISSFTYLRGHGANEIPESIGKLSSLRELSIDDFWYGLEYLPESIGNLRNLESLHIADCPNLKELPSTIGQLKNLWKLSLIECQLPLSNFEKLPDTIGKLTSLRELTIDSTILELLPNSLGNLKNLLFLQITHNEKLEQLPESIGELNNLRELIASKNHLISLPESIAVVKAIDTPWVSWI